MALAFALSLEDSPGTQKAKSGTCTIASYTASGETTTASLFGLGLVNRFVLEDGISSTGYHLRWDGTKIRAYKVNGGTGLATTEASAADNVGTFHATVYGY